MLNNPQKLSAQAGIGVQAPERSKYNFQRNLYTKNQRNYIMNRIALFATGFSQVFLVVLNTRFIAKEFLLGIIICGFLISFIWSHNVKKVAFGSEWDRIVYASGAMVGSVIAFYFGKLIY